MAAILLPLRRCSSEVGLRGRKAAVVALLAALLLGAAGTDARVLDGGVGAPDLATALGLRAVTCCGRPCCPLATDPGSMDGTWSPNDGGWWDESKCSQGRSSVCGVLAYRARPQPRSDACVVSVSAVKARASFSRMPAPPSRQGAPICCLISLSRVT